jgi:predicted phage terminase large subunit-like protein
MLMEGDWDVRPPGALFKRDWFPIFQVVPGRTRRRVRYWDLAATESKAGADPDWSVGTLYDELTGADVDFLVEHVERFRAEPGPLERRIRAVAIADGPEVEIVIEQEGGSAGKIAARALSRALDGVSVRFDRPTGSKPVRAGPFASAASQNRVGCLDGPWLEPWFLELETFDGKGGGSHDDQVDSASGAHAQVALTGGTTWGDLYSGVDETDGAADVAPA